MARRPGNEPIMSREDLEDFTRRLSKLSVPGVEGTYQTAYADCCYVSERQPAAVVQQLVAAWKVLRRMYRAK